jgi:hypothetical protein
MKKNFACFALLFAFFIPGFADAPASVQLGFYPKTYSAGEEVWVSLAVQNSTVLPGAYAIALCYSSTRLSYVRAMAAQSGPFAISPSVHTSGDTLTVAGFQGVQTEGNSQNTVLTVLVFKPAAAAAVVDSTSFGWISESIFQTDAKLLQLQMQITGAAKRIPDFFNAGAGKSTPESFFRVGKKDRFVLQRSDNHGRDPCPAAGYPVINRHLCRQHSNAS